MARGPQAAIPGLVVDALAPLGDAVCKELVRHLGDRDKAAGERAARTLKKISEADATALFAWRKPLLTAALQATDVRVQWNLSIVLGQLPLQGADKALAVELMFDRLRDRSGLNRTMALQALMDLSGNDAALRARVMPIVQEFLEHGTPAMKARARKLMAHFSTKNSQQQERSRNGR
jgi:hypothetical protein